MGSFITDATSLLTDSSGQVGTLNDGTDLRSMCFFVPSASCCRNYSEQFFFDGMCISTMNKLLNLDSDPDLTLTDDTEEIVEVRKSFVTERHLLLVILIHNGNDLKIIKGRQEDIQRRHARHVQ